MKVAAILENKGDRVATIEEGMSVRDVVAKLREEKVGALVVTPDGTTVAGILSERDVVRGLADSGPALLDKTAGDLMTRDVKVCASSEDIQHLMSLMTEHRIRHLPVVDGDRLCGIVSIGDVVKARLSELESETNALRQYIVS